MKLTQQKISAALKAHDLYFESYLNGDINNLSTLLVENYIQIGSVEEEVFFNKKDALKFVFDTIDQVAGKLEMRNRKTTPEVFDEFVLIFELCDLYVLIEHEWTFYSRFRATTLLQEKPEGWKIFHQHSSLPDSKAQEGDNIAIEKISEENFQLRDAIKRRTVELENKNRELEIEAALERVRATAMSMQRSEDLKTVVGVLYEQLRNLGFQNGIASIVIMDHDTGDMDCWNEGFGDGYVLPECYHVPFFDHSVHLQQLEHWKSGAPYAEIEVSGEEKKTYDAYYFFRTDFSHAPETTKQLMMQAESVRFSMAFMKYGALSWSPTLLSKDQATILERFAKVFEQCYTRFLDLQKAEAQTREAMIEAALERTRVKAMSIQKSNELKEIVKVVFDSLLKLDFIIRDGAVSILVFEKGSKEHIQWIADPDHVFPAFKVEFSDHTLLTDIISGWENGSIGYQKIYPFKEKREYFEFLFEHNPTFNATPLEIKNLLLESREYGYSIAFGKHSALSVATNIGKLLTPNEFEILKRFSNVFDQAYTRFLDILKAEAQTREAQIEAALEKVRSTSLAMHHSDELEKVVSVLFEKLTELKLKFSGAGIFLIQEKEKIIQHWIKGLGLVPIKNTLPYDPHFTKNEIIQDLWRAKKNGEPIINKSYSKESKNDFFQYVSTYNDSSRVPDEVKQFVHDAEAFTMTLAPEKNSILGLDSWSGDVTTDEDFGVLSRFSKVFEQAYVRFLDLQKAEAQAREAEIELALERVRAKTMAMHRSEELTDAATLLFQQIRDLGIKTWTTGFNVWINNDTAYIDYVTNPDGGFIEPYTINLTELPQLIEIRNAKKRGDEFFVRLEDGEQIKATYKYLMSSAPDQYEKLLKDGFPFPSHQYEHFVFGKNVSLMFITYEPVPEAHGIFKRFGNVFEQTYTRFLDLQKAEALAREAQVEAALERIRSRSLAMHKSDELKDVVAVVFEKLKDLGLTFDVAGIQLFREGSKDIVQWVAAPDLLSAPVPVNLPFVESDFNESEIIRDIWTAKEYGKSLHNKNYSFAEKNKFFDYAGKHNDLTLMPADVREFQMQAPGYTQSLVAEKYSALWVDSYTGQTISVEDFILLNRFAKVFDQAYTRFLDLEKAEAQAREAQIQAALEKIRSQSLAMHHSGELKDVITVFFDKLIELGALLGTVGIALFDTKSKDIFYWVGNEIQDPQLVAAPFDETMMKEDNFISLSWKAMKEQTEMINVVFPKEQKDRYFEHLFAHNDLIQIPESAREVLRKMDKHTVCFFPNRYSSLFADSWDGKRYSEGDINILRRAGKVFEQAYVRFLDLQKAEEQTREALIEAALERVRARTMAMQKSDDLKTVVWILYGQLKYLGFQFGIASIIIMDSKTGDMDWWNEGFGDGYVLPECYHVPFFEHSGHLRQLELWKSGTSYSEIEISGQDKKSYDDYYFYRTDFSRAPEPTKQLMMQEESLLFSMAFMKYGALSWSPTPLSQDQATILERFAKVFEQCYTRFLDLQIAEAQAREAQVEVAMERIRARALAMQSSAELSELAKVLRDQMGILGQEDLEASVVHLYSAGSPTFDSWYAFRAGDKIIEGQATFRLENSALAKEFLKLYFDDITEYTIEVKGEKLKEWLAEIKRNAPKIAAYWGDLPPEKQFYHFSDFSGGALLMVSHQNLSEETRMLQKRCALVFELAYKRFLDLEAKERQDKELREEKQRLEKALTELKATQSQLIQSEKMASLGQLTAGIAHEIKNPLNFVNNFSEVSAELIDEVFEELEKLEASESKSEIIAILIDVKNNIDKVTEHGKRADGIVKSMLQHSRSSGNKTESKALNPIVREFSNLAFHGMRAGKSPINVEIDLQLDPEVGEVKMISEDISRVILNLCNNAFDAMREKLHEGNAGEVNFVPKLIISTKRISDQEIQLTIKDNGKGIPKEIIDKILEPFFTTKKGTEGTGLGLSISYDIIKAHGGKLEVRSKVGIGTEFIIHLPIAN